MRFARYAPLSGLVLALTLTACGGGSDNPEPTPLNATLTVTGASDAALNGIYATTSLSLSDVEKKNPVGGEPEVCSFRFSGLQQAGSTRVMDGDVRYLPGTNTVHVMFVSISGLEFNTRERADASVDRANNEVDLSGKELTATVGGVNRIVLRGSVPMRQNRPEGC